MKGLLRLDPVLSAAFSRLASAARLGHGRSSARGAARQPAEPLVLYEYERCPVCRRAREALTELRLTTRVRPSPQFGARFRPEAIERAGRARFPLLVDPNTGVTMTESDAIVSYLYETYGDGPPPEWLFGPRFALSSQVASLLRGTAGLLSSPSVPPAQPLHLTADEADPGGRRVRERLCELEIEYLREAGSLRFQDPAEGVVLREANAVLEHLRRYAR